MDSERSSAKFGWCTPQRKSSKLKRAVGFFKHLGLKTCRKSCRPSKQTRTSNDSYNYQSKQTYEGYETPELADTSLGPAELPSDVRNDYKFWSDYVVEEGRTYEMEQPPPYNAMDIDEKNNGPISGRKTEPQLRSVSREIDDGLRNVSALFHSVDAESREFAENEMLVSPISDVQGSFYQVDIPNPAPKNRPQEVNSTLIPFETNPWLESVHSDRRRAPVLDDLVAAGTSLPDFWGIESRSARKPTSAQAQTEELRNLVHVINFEWIKRLDSAPDLRAPSSDYYIRSLFETGIQVLQRCYQNVLPTTFKEVFALMHIACGVYYIRHGNDTCSGWAGLFQDFLRWQYAMCEERDIQLLIAVINQLWRPDCVTPLQGPTASPAQALGSTVIVKPQSAHLFDLLRNGKIIRECSEFLNGELPHHVRCTTSFLTTSSKRSSAQA